MLHIVTINYSEQVEVHYITLFLFCFSFFTKHNSMLLFWKQDAWSKSLTSRCPLNCALGLQWYEIFMVWFHGITPDIIIIYNNPLSNENRRLIEQTLYYKFQ